MANYIFLLILSKNLYFPMVSQLSISHLSDNFPTAVLKRIVFPSRYRGLWPRVIEELRVLRHYYLILVPGRLCSIRLLLDLLEGQVDVLLKPIALRWLQIAIRYLVKVGLFRIPPLVTLWPRWLLGNHPNFEVFHRLCCS